MKVILLVLLSLALVACGNGASNPNLKPSWVEVSKSCSTPVQDAIILQCLNSDKARSIQSLLSLEAYLFSCLYSLNNRNPDFNLDSDHDFNIIFLDGALACQNVYQR